MTVSLPNLVMRYAIVDENNLRMLHPEKRFKKCASILKNEKDESARWDMVWLTGEAAEQCTHNDPLFNKVADMMSWVLQHDNNGIVKHEVCYQIAARNMRKKIPDLINASLNDESALVRHEAIESLGLMRAFESIQSMSKALKDPNQDVRETAAMVIKRLERLKKVKTIYEPSPFL